jgi:hypothetical protein
MRRTSFCIYLHCLRSSIEIPTSLPTVTDFMFPDTPLWKSPSLVPSIFPLPPDSSSSR